MAYRTRIPTGSLVSQKPVTVVTGGNLADISSNSPGISGNRAVTRVVTENPDSKPVTGAVTGRLPVAPRNSPVKSRLVTTVTAVTGNLNKRKSVAAKIKSVWRRIFSIDIEAKRSAAGLPSVANHLRHLDFRPTPLANQLLREIEASPLSSTAKRVKRIEQPYQESREPGICPGDVFRIFSNKARTVLTDEEIESCLGKDYRYTVPSRIAAPDKICRHCASRKAFMPLWRRNGKIVERVEADGRRVLACHYCGRIWKPKKG
jgi:hypothetical protein